MDTSTSTTTAIATYEANRQNNTDQTNDDQNQLSLMKQIGVPRVLNFNQENIEPNPRTLDEISEEGLPETESNEVDRVVDNVDAETSLFTHLHDSLRCPTDDPEDEVNNGQSSPIDGIVLKSNEANEFLIPNNISPILNSKPFDDSYVCQEGLQKIEEEDDDEETSNKRKRESFDDVSLISTDSMAPNFQSAKKPKLIRTGSITKTIRRSLSFSAMKTPITNMLRSRRNSVDPNASISSITSIESVFNDSIKNPIKEKLRCIRDRITKSERKEVNITPKLVSSNFDTLKRFCKMKGNPNGVTQKINDADVDGSNITFKTPIPSIAYHNHLRHSVSGSTPTTHTRNQIVQPTMPVSDISLCPVANIDTIPVIVI